MMNEQNRLREIFDSLKELGVKHCHELALLLDALIKQTIRLEKAIAFFQSQEEHDGTNNSAILIRKDGWIRKDSEDWLHLAMLDISPSTLRRRFEALEELGLIVSRSNPTDKFDNVIQYKMASGDTKWVEVKE